MNTADRQLKVPNGNAAAIVSPISSDCLKNIGIDFQQMKQKMFGKKLKTVGIDQEGDGGEDQVLSKIAVTEREDEYKFNIVLVSC